MHGQLVAYVLQWTDGTPDPNAVKVAALSLAGVVVATVGSVFLAFRSPREQREPRQAQRTELRLERTLQQRVADAEREAVQARKECTTAQGRVTAYERFLWLHHIDPAKIVRGDEGAEDVRF